MSFLQTCCKNAQEWGRAACEAWFGNMNMVAYFIRQPSEMNSSANTWWKWCICMWKHFFQGLLTFSYQDKTTRSFLKWLGSCFGDFQQNHWACTGPPKVWSCRRCDLDLSTELVSLASLCRVLTFKCWQWVTRSVCLEDQANQYHCKERRLEEHAWLILGIKKVVVFV